jgi:hypothetical protein
VLQNYSNTFAKSAPIKPQSHRPLDGHRVYQRKAVFKRNKKSRD